MPHSPTQARRVLVGFAFASLGNGLTLPFLYVYMAQVRDLGSSTAGWMFAWMGLVGLAAAPGVGALLDRVGPRPVLMGALALEAVSIGSLGFVDGLVPVMIVLAGVVVGASPLWPGTTTLLAGMVPAHGRERAYGFAFLGLNAGIGVGGLVSAFLVDVGRPESFQVLYLCDALAYLAYAVVLAILVRSPGPSSSDETATAAAGSWGEVLRDRRAVALFGCGVLAVTFGYGQLEAGATAYAVDVAEVPATALGWAFAANAAVIVCGQVALLRLTSRWRRTTALACAVLTWSLAWTVLATADLMPTAGAVAAIVVGLAVFGLGETLWAPVVTGLANTIAPDRLRGRYNACLGLTLTLGQILGPAIAGSLIGSGLGHLWAFVVIGGTLATGLVLTRLRALLSVEEDSAATPEPVADSQAAPV
ncbi:putative MFS family arabinose efflux permease [Nocardioides albertanoniae]|uniref:Putative MFS family arabinose efflux permease n=1 Tax=Nocardioides albertanoniae TaxID=1175486 RepID=A0A543A5H9_9ACTN|nr:MFS transporter [Nocardioides albertanoniae]TQL67845.1 putative MFS family arabinose efflux permease [Nocardioides albertanoniae]